MQEAARPSGPAPLSPAAATPGCSVPAVRQASSASAGRITTSRSKPPSFPACCPATTIRCSPGSSSSSSSPVAPAATAVQPASSPSRQPPRRSESSAAKAGVSRSVTRAASARARR
ncbi:MAG: hypothetical protein FJ125_00350 [Deltaproteobacteria bacterium]|nr:hypothetical protein [Deltaproteobacteria bacterium]